jgi:hypothetical protein
MGTRPLICLVLVFALSTGCASSHSSNYGAQSWPQRVWHDVTSPANWLDDHPIIRGTIVLAGLLALGTLLLGLTVISIASEPG